MSEYRALRASVLRLWKANSPDPDARDVDDITRFNESIDQSLAKGVSSFTQRIDQARDILLAILSHDLGNPLNSISMNAHLVPLIGHDESQAIECSHQLDRSVRLMERMIGDLLDYTRSRLGPGMPVRPAPMDVHVVCTELLAGVPRHSPGL